MRTFGYYGRGMSGLSALDGVVGGLEGLGADEAPADLPLADTVEVAKLTPLWVKVAAFAGGAVVALALVGFLVRR